MAAPGCPSEIFDDFGITIAEGISIEVWSGECGTCRVLVAADETASRVVVLSNTPAEITRPLVHGDASRHGPRHERGSLLIQ